MYKIEVYILEENLYKYKSKAYYESKKAYLKSLSRRAGTLYVWVFKGYKLKDGEWICIKGRSIKKNKTLTKKHSQERKAKENFYYDNLHLFI